MSQVEKKEKLPFEDEEEILREARRYFDEADQVRKEEGDTDDIARLQGNLGYVWDFDEEISDEIVDGDSSYPKTRTLFDGYDAPNNRYGRALSYLETVGMIGTWGDETVGKTRWDLTVIEDDESFESKLDALTTEKNLDYIAPGLDKDKIVQDTQ